MSLQRDPHREVDRYLGLCLGGAKSDRTCLSVIDHYRKQNKAFVVDVFEAVGPQGADYSKDRDHELTADQVLLELINEHQPGIHTLATDAPLTLPPGLFPCEENCQGYEKCKKPEIKWMRAQYKKAKTKNPKLKHFTPYTQRPVELYFRYKYPGEEPFQDETLGANLAPQAARMHYLQRHLKEMNLVEVWPKLTLFTLLKSLKISKRDFLEYRSVESGLLVREKILSHLAEKSEVFIYERDFKKIIHNIAAFDSIICAWTALQFGKNQCVEFKHDLPLASGWITLPTLD